MAEELKEFTLEELSAFNGEDGQPMYIAYDGKIFDVSESNRWKNGSHMNRHHAGTDLTADMASAPHTEEKLENFPQVGTLAIEEEPDRDDIPVWLTQFLDQFPFLWRHPHPMLVHFPIVTMLFCPLFGLLYLITGYTPFELTSFHLLGAGVLFSTTAILSGFATWKLNYMAQPMMLVNLKTALSFIMISVAVIIFVWRWINPNILNQLNGLGALYLGLMLLLLPLVGIVGWAGAELTFPSHKGGRE